MPTGRSYPSAASVPPEGVPAGAWAVEGRANQELATLKSQHAAIVGNTEAAASAWRVSAPATGVIQITGGKPEASDPYCPVNRNTFAAFDPGEALFLSAIGPIGTWLAVASVALTLCT